MIGTTPSNLFKVISTVIFLCMVIGCEVNSQSMVGKKVSKAEDWSQLFIRNQGWFGGDGIFAIPMDGKEFVPATDSTETLFLFSDTMVGSFQGDTLLEGNFTMVNNSLGILTGGLPDDKKIEFIVKQDQKGEPTSIFYPQTPNVDPEHYYWLGDGFVNVDVDSTLYIFAYLIAHTDDEVFAFRQVGVSLISIPYGSKPPFENHTQVVTPFFVQTEHNGAQTSFGSAIYVNTKSAGAPNPDGYIYVYAVKGVYKELLVGRVKPSDFTDFNKWKFWDGSKWSQDMISAAPITNAVSNEMSVSPLPNGDILLTYQFMTAQPEVAIQVGSSLTGPFEPMQKIYRTEEVDQDKDFLTYNAKAHPHLSPEGSVLICYNVNSYDFFNDILSTPNLYRPRFILWKID